MIVDAAMARRMESALARAAAAVAQARAEQEPAAGAGALPWVGGCLVELGPYTDGSLVAVINTRGLRLSWSRDVLFREITAGDAAHVDDGLEVHVVAGAIVPRWQRVHRRGSEVSAAAAKRSDTHTAAANAVSGRIDLLATVEGRDVGAASVMFLDGCAVLGGAATVAQWRHRGVQTALIRRRLQLAANAGCDLVVVEADPGASSERNLRRLGFQIAYTKSGVVAAES